MKAVLRFDADGSGHCLHTEAIPLQSLGRLTVARATSIEFNHEPQVWEVSDPVAGVIYRHASRQACLDWEHRIFNR